MIYVRYRHAENFIEIGYLCCELYTVKYNENRNIPQILAKIWRFLHISIAVAFSRVNRFS